MNSQTLQLPGDVLQGERVCGARVQGRGGIVVDDTGVSRFCYIVPVSVISLISGVE